LAEITSKVLTNPDSLSQTEKIRYFAYEHIFYDSWETLWVGYQDGLVEEKTWNGWDKWFLREVKHRSILGMEGNIENFDKEFLLYIKKNLEIQ
jgi:hypothetical protein